MLAKVLKLSYNYKAYRISNISCEVGGCRHTEERCHCNVSGFPMEQVYTKIIGERSLKKWQNQK